jgi:hypothetical protein
MKPRRNHPAVFSLVFFCASLGVLFYVDQRNDLDLLAAVDGAAETHCEIANSAVHTTKQGFLRIALAVPGDSPAEIDFVDWIRRCLDDSVDCANPPVSPPPRDADCEVAPPLPSTTTSGG